MIELIDNVTQLTLTGACAGIALYFAVRSGAHEWIPLMTVIPVLIFGRDLYRTKIGQ